MANYFGTPGPDNYPGTPDDDLIFGDLDIDSLSGGGGNDRIFGGRTFSGQYVDVASVDTLDGGPGDDLLGGGPGDNLDGGAGAGDIFILDLRSLSVGVTVDFSALWSGGSATVAGGVIAGMEGYQQILGTAGDDVITLGANAPSEQRRDLTTPDYFRGVWGGGGLDRITGGNAADWLFGEVGDDVLTGGGGNDRLEGGIGADTMDGGAGDDLYRVDTLADVLIDASGLDSVQVDSIFLDYTLPAGIEQLFLTNGGTGRGNDADGYIQGGPADASFLYGMGGLDTLDGGAANDLLDGGTGADVLRGGLGDDLYIVDDGGDALMEAASAGLDSARSSINYRLWDNVEQLFLTGTAEAGTGTELDNYLEGNGVTNALYGLDGRDTLRGLGGNDVLFGGAGEDVLDGGVGQDTMIGGAGDDLAYVDQSNETVTEAPNEGLDTVISSADFALPSNVEQLVLTGTALSGRGNSGDNAVRGNAVDNELLGFGGDDTLFGEDGGDRLDGGVGADVLYGGAGDDNLNGGATAIPEEGDNRIDSLFGGVGDDKYFIYQANDVVVELSGEGSDTVFTLLDNYVLPQNVENLFLLYSSFSRSGPINGTGSAVNNVLTGNREDNVLRGLGGDDVIDGGGGRNRIDGGAGNDTLTGGFFFLGASGTPLFSTDIFVYDAAGFGNDTITDFTTSGAAADKLLFSAAVFADDAAVLAAAMQVGNDTRITASDGSFILLLNVTLNTLNGTHFDFI